MSPDVIVYTRVIALVMSLAFLFSGLVNIIRVIYSVEKAQVKQWYFLSFMIVFFILSYAYLLYLVFYSNNFFYHLVTLIFFVGAVFVYFVTKISIATINAYKRIAVLQVEAENDYLTGIINRRYFIKHFRKVLDMVKREGPPSTLVMMDLDHFKMVNDIYGHPAGDTVLKRFASILVQNTRKSDIVARFGGDEFVVVFYNADIQAAKEKCTMMRSQFVEYVRANYPKVEKIGCSFGYADINGDTISINNALSIADDMCYQEKEKK